MENEIQPSAPPVQPLPQAPNSIPSHTNWPKILLFIALGLIVVAGSVFAGIQIGKKQITNQQQITEQPTISPTQTAVNPTAIPTTQNPATNPTADWKTYKNESQAYSIKYPQSFYLKELNISDTINPTTVFYFEELKKNEILPQSHIGIVVYKNEDLSLSDWFKKHSTDKPLKRDQEITKENSAIFYWGVKNIINTNVVGNNTMQFETTTISGKTNSYSTIVGKNKKIYDIYHFLPPENYKDTYKLMLKTIDFIE